MSIQWNSLYLQWLQEWGESLVTTSSQGSVGGSNLRRYDTIMRAYRSLEGCPKVFQHPSELKELKYFGEIICSHLLKQAKVYCASHGLLLPPDPVASRVSVQFDHGEATTGNPAKRATTRQPRQWVPRYRSGGYGILLALWEHQNSTHFHGQGLGRSDIIRMAKEYCDSSFDVNPSSKTFYSAWSSVNTLVKNGLVYASSARNAHYFLTEAGSEVAQRLAQVEAETQGRTDNFPTEVRHIPPAAMSATHATHATTPGSYLSTSWPMHAYTIRLLLDNREVKSTSQRDYFAKELAEAGVDVEVKPLPVGDVVWVAQHKETGQQVIIDYILERKRIDDLVSSIKDGRFTEQKSRLHRTSLAHTIYLVEEPPGISVGTYAQHASTAMSQIVAIDRFYLKRTSGPEDTVRYIAEVTSHLASIYLSRQLTVVYPHIQTFKSSLEKARRDLCPDEESAIAVDYDSFNVTLSKTGMLTVRDIYIKMLMTIRGITYDKATAIQKIYPTPRALWKAYQEVHTQAAPQDLIYEALKSNISRKKVGKTVSAKVYDVWGKPVL